MLPFSFQVSCLTQYTNRFRYVTDLKGQRNIVTILEKNVGDQFLWQGVKKTVLVKTQQSVLTTKKITDGFDYVKTATPEGQKIE